MRVASDQATFFSKLYSTEKFSSKALFDFYVGLVACVKEWANQSFNPNARTTRPSYTESMVWRRKKASGYNKLRSQLYERKEKIFWRMKLNLKSHSLWSSSWGQLCCCGSELLYAFVAFNKFFQPSVNKREKIPKNLIACCLDNHVKIIKIIDAWASKITGQLTFHYIHALVHEWL